MLELSNYWDDFKERVNESIDCIKNNTLPNLQRLTVHITESCNLHCEYCNMNFSSKTMDKKLVFKIIDEYVDMCGNIIHFTGGEPSVVDWIDDVFKYAKDKGLTVSANTNGFKRMNTAYIDKLKTSFDTSIKSDFNKMMGKDCFDIVVSNMKYYSETMKDKMLSITAVLNRNTYKNMLDLAKFVQEEFSVYNLYYSNYKGSDLNMAFTSEEIADMFENYIPKVLQYFKETGNDYSYKQLALYHPTDFENVAERFPDNKIIPCYIQLSEMTIDVDGSCHNCSHLFRDKVLPTININVAENTLNECFTAMKESLHSNYTFLSDKCLNGCNCNLIGFNKTVHEQKYI